MPSRRRGSRPVAEAEPQPASDRDCWLEATRCAGCLLRNIDPDESSDEMTPEQRDRAKDILWRAVCTVRELRLMPAHFGEKNGKRAARTVENFVSDRVGRTNTVAYNATVDTIYYTQSGACVLPEEPEYNGIPSNYADYDPQTNL